ncbi:unnamed protein product [Arabis nemorensis]|uniref:Uncharacterized protein n=1 Tax=Arabis nemorensis TaxID=586526 RepID=A0A565APQ2_9BRAS|nr:unnamed protein product [Arabis nemorensis]
MQRSSLRFLIGQSRRGFCTISDKIVASIQLATAVKVYNWFLLAQFKFAPSVVKLSISSLVDLLMRECRAKGEYQMDYVPAPRITEADKKNDRK